MERYSLVADTHVFAAAIDLALHRSASPFHRSRQREGYLGSGLCIFLS